MLQYLKIKNLALLEEVTLEFDSGFTVVTGETGAGKSVLLGALSLLSGGRADKTMIRQGADQLEVEGAVYFADSRAIDSVLTAFGLPNCEEGVLLLQRCIHLTKMPRIQINGSMATLAQLRSLGEEWIDFHGPGEPQKLSKERHQLEMLDLYAGNANHLLSYKEEYKKWCKACEEISNLEKSEQLNEDEIDFLREQIRQIDSLQISKDSIEALESDYARLSSARELASLAMQCSTCLLGEQGLTDQLSKVVSYYETLADHDDHAGALLERVRSLLIELQDLGEETEHLASDYDFDADQIERITERMNQWQEIRRKYGGSIETVITKREAMAQKLATQGDIETVLKEKQKHAADLEKKLRAEAAQLREIREKAAAGLTEKATKLLQALGFKNARLEVTFITEPELREFGDSRCVLEFTANVGQTPLPLAKIASSGEMARVMLALKVVLAEADKTPLLVFDEVGANVGGEIGRSVGKEMAKLSTGHQVLCVTHLPQVASLAQNHFVVTKLQENESTVVQIKPIHASDEERLGELARMLGDRSSESAKTHARNLLV